MQLSCD